MKKITSRLLPISFYIGVLFLLFVINSCGSKTNDIVSLSPDFPVHNIDYNGSIAEIQAQFDKKQWETFIALCWPADGLNPAHKGNILDNKDHRPVFENYAFNYDLFLLNLRNKNTNYKPIGWGQTDSLDMQRRARWEKDCPDLLEQAKTQKITNLASILPMDEFIQASNGAKPHVPIIDQNGKYVWSSVVFNKTTFDFVNEGDLFLWKGINDAKKDFVEKRVYSVENDTITFKKSKYNQLQDENGSMHLKTSWKIMGEGDDTSKFHTAWAAQIFNNVNFVDENKLVPQCSLVHVGLVGMHISYKTEDQQSFIWSTFEHIDNAPERGDIKDKNYNFFDYANRNTKVNNQPPTANENVNDRSSKVATKDTFADPKWFNPFTDTNAIPSQVVRYDPISEPTKLLNKSYQQALSNTVWANYELISTQWTHPDTEKYYPKRLYNTTLESFDQEGSSCIGCHHQVLPNTLLVGPNKDQYFMEPDTIGNVLNLPLNLFEEGPHPDTGVYADYMWSMLKWSESGHLTWKQIKK